MKIMQKNKMIFVLLLALLFMVLFAGCMNILAEDLYSLPRLSDEYLRLQSKIDDVLEQGAILSPPTGGTSRQAIQMRDLIGDGVDEVLAFFSFSEEGMLNLQIFVSEEGEYSLGGIIEVRGASFENVRFVDMDGDGIQEIAMGWQVSPMLRQMEIFSIVDDFNATSLARTNYIDFIDFDITGDGHNDVIIVAPSTQGDGIAISSYSLMSSGELIISSLELMMGIEAYIQILTGRLLDDTPAVFIESEIWTEEGYRVDTEIIIFYGGELTKTTLNG